MLVMTPSSGALLIAVLVFVSKHRWFICVLCYMVFDHKLITASKMNSNPNIELKVLQHFTDISEASTYP